LNLTAEIGNEEIRFSLPDLLRVMFVCQDLTVIIIPTFLIEEESDDTILAKRFTSNCKIGEFHHIMSNSLIWHEGKCSLVAFICAKVQDEVRC
jgi:hypothetical protein